MSRSRIVDYIRWMDLTEVPADFVPHKFGKAIGNYLNSGDDSVARKLIEMEHKLIDLTTKARAKRKAMAKSAGA